MEMDALALISELEDVIDKAVAVPFTGRCLIDKEELMDLLQEIRLKLPTDLEQAKWIKAERENILADARKEAEEIIKSANDEIISMVDENEITKKAAEKASEIMERATADAKTTKASAYQYADYLLENVEGVVSKTINDLQQCISIVQDNRKQLK